MLRRETKYCTKLYFSYVVISMACTLQLIYLPVTCLPWGLGATFGRRFDLLGSARSFSRPPPPQEGEGPFRQGISHKQPELGLGSPNVCANICSVLLHGIKFGPRTTLDVVDLIQLHSMPLLVPQPNLVFHIGGDQGLVACPQTGMRVHPKEAQYLSRLDAQLEGRLDGFARNAVKNYIGQSPVVGDVAKQAQHGHMQL